MGETSITHDEPKRMTLEEWAALDGEVRGELVDGMLVEEELPSYLHEFVIAWLARTVGLWGASRGAVVTGSGAKFGVGRNRGRMPDLTVYLAGAPQPPLEGLVGVPPSIAVEVVTPTPRDARRDRVEKLAEYAAFGVPWYWLVDPELRTFEVLELGSDRRYVHAAAATEGVMETIPGCDGLSIDVGALWAEIEDLVEEKPPST
jgi:Uma2 family endonuclease